MKLEEANNVLMKSAKAIQYQKSNQNPAKKAAHGIAADTRDERRQPRGSAAAGRMEPDGKKAADQNEPG
jgi:hypothetical protein